MAKKKKDCPDEPAPNNCPCCGESEPCVDCGPICKCGCLMVCNGCDQCCCHCTCPMPAK
jgi:hypothetical protein